MAGDTVQKIKDKLSIVDVVSGYVKLERAGASMRARCPFHAERTPSFHVSPERGTYHCFGCNVGGDIFTFIQEIEGLDFKGALKVLAEKAGVEIVYERKENHDERERLFEVLEVAAIFFASRLTDEARAYLKERGVSEETVRTFRIGWVGDAWSEASEYFKQKKFTDKEIVDAGLAVKGDRGIRDKFRNRIVFPISDSAGRVVGFSGRIFGEKASPEAPKYLNSPETPLFHKSRILYGFDKAKLAIRKHNFAILVEGQMDLILSHQSGWSNTVAVSGTAFTGEHAALLKRMSDNLLLALDADEAGIKAAGKAARVALQGGLNVKVARLPSGLDPADLIARQGLDAWKTAIRDGKDIITFLLDVLGEHVVQKDKFRRAVETIVLPYLADVQSPIEREQYFKEIGKRLGVSEDAVREAFAKMPQAQAAPAARGAQGPAPRDASKVDRVRQAYALFLWQKAQRPSAIDADAFEKELGRAAGEEVVAALASLGEKEREALRFWAAEHHGHSGSVGNEAAELIRLIRLDTIKARQAAIGRERDGAEESGDTGRIQELDKEWKLLTGEIAKLQERV
jgi:DNA primase